MSGQKATRLKSARFWRRLSQVFFLAFFLYLIFRGHGEPVAPDGWHLRNAVNPDVVFLANPVTWVLSVIASRSLIEKSVSLMVFFVGLALLFGRVFCGWVCPLGTIIDASARLLRPAHVEISLDRQSERTKSPRSTLPPLVTHRTKYYMLVVLTVAALGGVNIVGWFDPLAILMRATVFGVVPAAHWWLRTSADFAEQFPVLGSNVRPLRVWLEQVFFSSTPHSYGQAALHVGIFVLVVGLTRLHRRWWCQYLCPLGAFYGLVSRLAPLRRWIRTPNCNECGVCGNSCRMQAVVGAAAAAVDEGDCVRCMECAERCPRGGITFSFLPAAEKEARSEAAALDLGRRGLLVSLASGIAAIPLIKMTPERRSNAAAVGMDVPQDEWLLRPPGAQPEPQFLRLCIRCGECLRICPQNALHPTLWEAGLEGLWTPRVVPRLGYCEPSCTLCSQVCPTTAIKPLRVRTKRNHVRIGTAHVDRNRCLAWTNLEECGVCQEFCPVAPKAIELRGGGQGRGRTVGENLPAPEVIVQRCIGCGICENKCPVEGQAAIRVHRRGETRHQITS
ncbi:MAG: 4Fe-4S binding protein [Candidatus Sumerlaeaceae bacterium]|nr:4Fe-4S binding protein [Candidatus Sumerlaeaceae bacterium]